MKTRQKIAVAMIFGTLSLGAGLASAYDLPVRGPIPFTAWDTDSNGTIEEQEFNTIREQRQTMVKASGHMGRNQSVTPTFAQTDTDNDAKITTEELTAMQQDQWTNQSMGKHHGGGKTIAKNQHGMRQGYHAKGQAMTGKRGMRYQAMDAETKGKYYDFFKATTELRKEIAIKRAEKQAVMRSNNPDPKQAGQLTGELFELRAQMVAQAEEAGVVLAQNERHGNGHGGGRHGGGSR